MLNHLFHAFCFQTGFDDGYFRIDNFDDRERSAEYAYSSMAPDPTIAFIGCPCGLTLKFTFAFWIMITFDTFLISLFCILKTLVH
jgi:hypothetical protein